MTSAGLVAEQARLLPVEAVMAQLGVGRSTVFELFSSRQLRSVKIGRRRLVPQSAVDEFIARLLTGDADETEDLRDDAETEDLRPGAEAAWSATTNATSRRTDSHSSSSSSTQSN